MYKLSLLGSYPGQNLVLKDGSLLTLFWTKVRNFNADGKRNGTEYIFAAQHTDRQRKSVSEPVILQKWLDAPDQPDMKCSSYLSAPAAYDPKTNTVYATYLDGSNGRCTLTLEKSTDDGQTWTASAWSEKPASNAKDAISPAHEYGRLAIARRDDGTLALLWHDNQPDEWLFATSTDDGKTYSTPQPIAIEKTTACFT